MEGPPFGASRIKKRLEGRGSLLFYYNDNYKHHIKYILNIIILLKRGTIGGQVFWRGVFREFWSAEFFGGGNVGFYFGRGENFFLNGQWREFRFGEFLFFFVEEFLVLERA